MNQKNKIIKALHEADDKPTVMVPDVADVKPTMDKVGDEANIRVLPVDEMDGEDHPMYVEYLSDKPDEPEFDINGKKFQYVWAKYPNGKRDIGAYAIGQDLVYGIEWFQKNVLGQNVSPSKPKADIPQDDYERASRGVEFGTGDIYENTNPRMSKRELQEMITGKKQPKILKTVKVKNIK
jgi:hypothetical protein